MHDLDDPLLSAVRSILMEEWDPIGVASFENAAGEYDLYAHGVLILLREGKGMRSIRDYLHESATVHIGLDYPALDQRSEAAARRIVREAGKLSGRHSSRKK